MKISECSFCGVMTITDNDVCASCQAFVTPETQVVTPPEANSFQPAAQSELTPAFAGTPPPEQLPQSFPNRSGFANSYQSPQPVMDARCVRCKTLIARGQNQCFDCENRKSSPLKFFAVFTILAVVIGFFSFDYVYEQISPHGIFRKYAKTTGADDSLVYENFVLTGDTYVSVDAPPGYSSKGLTESNHTLETFTFKMIFKKPNLTSIEFMRDGATGKYTAFKQVFDGARGWKYMNMPNQPAGYQDTDDGFASKKMGLGMDEFDSLEFINEATAQEFGKDRIKALTDIKEVEVTDIKKPSGEKVMVVGKQKRNGKTESSLLVFDQKTGLLLGTIKNVVMNNMTLTTTIYFNNYARFPVKRKGFLGVEETRVLVPTKMSYVTSADNSAQVNGMPVITIELNVKEVETDAQIENSYFTR